ncbi:GGDEF domain-containing protein [uncultured Cocleimonas sp.]|uniref:GGDEF domain-containing protein n=1 Tax=uncultured Cocleimonas sp. TaxID=1051587 RepID=UPI00260D4DBB|nr:GGDEF domain-containing protein [uncultured Cocleimonas sp.]
MNINTFKTKYKSISFGDNLADEKVNSTRVIVILGSLLYVLYSVMDYFGFSKDVLIQLYIPRAANLILYAFIYYLTYKREFFLEHYNNILMSGYVVSGIAICFAIFIARDGDYSHGMYFAALMVLVYNSFTWSYLPTHFSVILGAMLLVSYAIIKIYVHQDATGSHFLLFIGQVFYLMSLITVAATSKIIRDNLISKNMLLQDKLTKIARVKTLEAERHAKLANLDALTGLPNRRSMTKRMRQALEEAKQSNTKLTLIFIDLNGFKKVNDHYGHDSGDKVLEITAKRLLQTIRKEDYVARLGGDEFLIGLKTNCFTDQFIKTLCKKIRINVSAHIAYNGCKLHVGTSIGIASYPEDGDNIEELVKVADRRMYIDKQQCKKEITPSLSESLI